MLSVLSLSSFYLDFKDVFIRFFKKIFDLILVHCDSRYSYFSTFFLLTGSFINFVQLEREKKNEKNPFNGKH